MTDKIDQAALNYHENPKPGKLEVVATKPLATQRDLALAYSPGVAAACREIVKEPANSSRYTARGNLVGVITNGTAVLGLGAIGPLASKPVMEGKAVLFKKFAGIDVFDIEIDETDPKKMIDIIASLEPTFGAINLEDIKAPECFTVERELRKRMNIPVFHDDQHGTAIVSGAAIFNGLRVVGKEFADVKLVSTGGGAAGIACLNLLVSMGLKPENITLVDRIGVVYKGRKEEMDPQKDRYAIDTKARKLDDVIDGADIFLGLSAPGVLTKDMVSRMADKPIIMALANPEPEITPDDVKSVRSDAVIATGRSDFPNQVNNVLCFPFIFRGALDVGATTINEKMKVACVKAIANLAMAESSDVVASAYSGEDLMFGPEYLIPKPFDPRLIVEIAPAIAKAAMDSGVATRPIEDFDAYLGKLNRFVFRSGMLMKPVFERAKRHPKRLVYTEGESRRVLRAVQVVVDEGLARPVLIGRPDVIESRIEKLGLRLKVERDYDLCNPEDDPRYEDYWRTFHKIVERKGVSPDAARTIVRTNTTVIAALMVYRGEADTMICGTYGQYTWHLKYILDVLGLAEGVRDVSALSALILPKGTFFFCDTHITKNPSVDELVEMTAMASDAVRRFGEVPKVALLSHSNFGSDKSLSAQKMAAATRILRETLPDLEVEGEMHADSALNEELRTRIFPNSRLSGQANLLIFPTLDAANAAFNLAKSLGEGISVGPILLGAAKPVHILTPSITVRGIVNMSAVAVVDAHIASKNAES
ncbi:MAG: NADP-dependent malic enzyme [Rhodospirillales bacterium]|nr:NADP-dependent malic enzyme [Rhodospirillales bacterium]